MMAQVGENGPCPTCGAVSGSECGAADLKLYSSEEAAILLGLVERSITRRAQKHQIGAQVRSVWVFTDQDLENMARLPGPGRPPLKEATG